MSYESTSGLILESVGGTNNIENVTHCATRLRFVLKNTEITHKDLLENNNEIMGVVESGGQFQIVIGTHVSEVYKEIIRRLTGEKISSNINTTENVIVPEDTEKNKVKKIDMVFSFISGSFSPLLPAIAGVGMIKALLAIALSMSLMSPESSTYIALNGMSNGIIYFMPIFLGVTAAFKLGCNPYVAGAIGAALLEPTFVAFTKKVSATGFTLFELPIKVIDYSSSVFPILFSVLILSFVEKLLIKITPKSISLFLVPMLSLIFVSTLTLFIFGPFGVYLSAGIAEGIKLLSVHSGLVTGAVLGGGITFMVLMGLHWGLIPIIMSNIITTGSDSTVGMTVAAIYAQVGVALAILIRSKDKDLKALSLSSALTGLLAGVTEPILYGLVLKYKKVIPVIAAAGAIGGAINGAYLVKINGFALQGVFSFALFTPFIPFIIGISVALVIAFVATFIINPSEA